MCNMAAVFDRLEFEFVSENKCESFFEMCACRYQIQDDFLNMEGLFAKKNEFSRNRHIKNRKNIADLVKSLVILQSKIR